MHGLFDTTTLVKFSVDILVRNVHTSVHQVLLYRTCYQDDDFGRIERSVCTTHSFSLIYKSTLKRFY